MRKQSTSGPSVGVWIDHREATIVFASEQERTATHISSNVQKQLRREGSSPTDVTFESQLVPADDSRERRLTGLLARYYDEVIENLQRAQSILIFGPGEAKRELKKRLELSRCDGRVLYLQAAERMTERQIASKVEEHFHPAVPSPISYAGEILRKHRN
jgi:hypothetical protein